MRIFAILVIAILLVIGYVILVGAAFAFLWNAILVGALALNIPTINLWVGVGITMLLSLVGGLLSRK